MRWWSKTIDDKIVKVKTEAVAGAETVVKTTSQEIRTLGTDLKKQAPAVIAVTMADILVRLITTASVFFILYRAYPILQSLTSKNPIGTFEKFWLMTTLSTLVVYGYFYIYYPLKYEQEPKVSPGKKLLTICFLGILLMVGRFQIEMDAPLTSKPIQQVVQLADKARPPQGTTKPIERTVAQQPAPQSQDHFILDTIGYGDIYSAILLLMLALSFGADPMRVWVFISAFLVSSGLMCLHFAERDITSLQTYLNISWSGIIFAVAWSAFIIHKIFSAVKNSPLYVINEIVEKIKKTDD